MNPYQANSHKYCLPHNNKKIKKKQPSLYPLSKNPCMKDNIDKQIIRNYTLIQKVGKGAYGQVWKCLNKKDKKICALKRIYDAFRNVTDCQRTYRQIMYLKQLQHPNIVGLFDYFVSDMAVDVYLEMEFVDADLAAVLKKQILKDTQRQYIFAQIVAAVYYLHSADLLHRDIKPSNILIGPNCEVKICDFGLVRSLRTASNENEQNKLTDNIATRWYKAPELLLSSCRYGKQIDIWSLGCILAQLYIGQPLFMGTSSFNQLQKIIQVTGVPCISQISPIIQSETSLAVLQSFLNDLPRDPHLKKTASTRSLQTTGKSLDPEIAVSPQNLQHSLQNLIPVASFTNNPYLIDLLRGLLQFDPRKRFSINQIVQHPYLEKWKSKIQLKSRERVKVAFDGGKLGIEDYRVLLSNDYKKQRKDSLSTIPSKMPNVVKPSRQSITKTAKLSFLKPNLTPNKKQITQNSIQKSQRHRQSLHPHSPHFQLKTKISTQLNNRAQTKKILRTEYLNKSPEITPPKHENNKNNKSQQNHEGFHKLSQYLKTKFNKDKNRQQQYQPTKSMQKINNNYIPHRRLLDHKQQGKYRRGKDEMLGMENVKQKSAVKGGQQNQLNKGERHGRSNAGMEYRKTLQKCDKFELDIAQNNKQSSALKNNSIQTKTNMNSIAHTPPTLHNQFSNIMHTINSPSNRQTTITNYQHYIPTILKHQQHESKNNTSNIDASQQYLVSRSINKIAQQPKNQHRVYQLTTIQTKSNTPNSLFYSPHRHHTVNQQYKGQLAENKHIWQQICIPSQFSHSVQPLNTSSVEYMPQGYPKSSSSMNLHLQLGSQSQLSTNSLCSPAYSTGLQHIAPLNFVSYTTINNNGIKSNFGNCKISQQWFRG